MWGWLLHVLGVDDVSGRWYAFWSGFAGDLSEVALVGGLAGVLRHKNCHVKGCWRLGRHHVGGTAYVVCAHHHPVGAPSAQDVMDAHACYREGGESATGPVDDIRSVPEHDDRSGLFAP